MMQALEDSIDIDAIVFGGCSIFGCVYLGALAALDDLNLLHRIKRVAGVSSVEDITVCSLRFAAAVLLMVGVKVRP